jgi:hypothetical protein
MQIETVAMAQQMRQHIEACKASGMYVEEYCKLNQVRPSSYYYWRKKILGAAKPNTGAFIRLQPSAPVGSVEVVFASGVKIYFDNLVPVEYLKQLVN